MAATDKFSKVLSGATRPVATTLSAQKISGATSASVVATTGWETSTPVHGIMYRTDAGTGAKVAGSQIDFKADVSGTTLTNFTVTAGTDDTYEIGTTVELSPTAAWGDDMATGILVEHNQDGTHGAVTATSVSTTDLTVTNAPTFTIGGAIYKQSKYYTYDGTDIFVDGVDQNNGANTINWSKPTGVKFVVVEVVGGGGGGGGCPSTTAGQYGSSGGGGGGAYARKKILAASLGSTETVTVGARGAGGSAGANAGSAGGQSSFGSHVSANGGSGAAAGAVATSTNGQYSDPGNGSSTTSGEDFKVPGQGGGAGQSTANNNNAAVGGSGGSSFLGFGAYGRIANNTASAATGYGGGGSGLGSGASQSAKAGGNGAAGIVIVHEYY